MFLALLDGGGGGCDYSIDCNKTWRRLKAKTIEEAKIEVAIAIKEYGRSESKVEKATILLVDSEVDFDVKGFWKAIDAKRAKDAAEKKLAEDKAAYEKLKKQFEG